MTADKPDLLDALRHYDIDVQPHRVEQVVICPNPDHDEDHPSCTVNSSKGVFSCKSCGFQGDVYHLIAKREGCETFAATRKAALRLFGTAGAGAPARGGRQGLSGRTSSARPGFRPAFGRAGFRRGDG